MTTDTDTNDGEHEEVRQEEYEQRIFIVTVAEREDLSFWKKEAWLALDEDDAWYRAKYNAPEEMDDPKVIHCEEVERA